MQVFWRIYCSSLPSQASRETLKSIYADLGLSFEESPMPHIVVRNGAAIDVEEIVERLAYMRIDVICSQRDIGVPP